jgi:hypothetical protein
MPRFPADPMTASSRLFDQELKDARYSLSIWTIPGEFAAKVDEFAKKTAHVDRFNDPLVLKRICQ